MTGVVDWACTLARLPTYLLFYRQGIFTMHGSVSSQDRGLAPHPQNQTLRPPPWGPGEREKAVAQTGIWTHNPLKNLRWGQGYYLDWNLNPKPCGKKLVAWTGIWTCNPLMLREKEDCCRDWGLNPQPFEPSAFNHLVKPGTHLVNLWLDFNVPSTSQCHLRKIQVCRNNQISKH